MEWDLVMEAWCARWNGDAALIAMLKGERRINPAQAVRPVQVPSMEYLLTSDHNVESFNAFTVQLDFWIRGAKAARDFERRLREGSHRDVWQELGGMHVALQCVDAHSIEYSAEAGVFHRVLIWSVEIIRQKYATLTEES